MPQKVKLTRTDVYPKTAESGQTVAVTATIDVIYWTDVWLKSWLNVYVKETGTGIIYWDGTIKGGYAVTQGGTFAMPNRNVTVRFEAYHHDGDKWVLDQVAEVPVTLSVAPPEDVDTTLTMTPSKTRAVEGETVTFTGRLTRRDTGAGVPNQLIYLFDDDSPDPWDDQMGSGYTDANGNYSIRWSAKPMDPWPFHEKVEAYAYFEGGEIGMVTLKKSSSTTVNITVITAVDTTLSIRASTIRPVEGQIVTFTGKLTRVDTGAGVSGQLITIYDKDFLLPDNMGTGYTDAGGNYSIEWSARKLDVWPFTKVEAFAKFEGAEV